MKQVYLLLIFCLMSVVGWGQMTIHCWDFNGTASGGTFNSSPINTDNRVTGNGTITHNITDTEDFAGSSSNACSGSSTGAAFCPRGGTGQENNGNSFVLAFPTTGYESITLSFWARRTGTGFNNNTIEYSTNGGSSYTNLTTFSPSSSSGGSVESFDFSGISAINNNADFQIRITLNGSTSSTGNNRYDNIKLEGTVVLPINLISFAAEEINQLIHLHWRTSTEVNNDYMAIERSSDGRTFEEIGRVQGRGTTQIEQSYSFVDEWPLPGINYYRLRQVDFDGRYEYHETVAVDFSDKTTGKLLVYPTQVDSHLKIVADSEMNKDAQVQVLSADGKIWKTTHWLEKSTLMELSVDKLPAGSYWLRVLDGERVDQAYFQKI